MEEKKKNQFNKIKHKILILSGKGGVGKSTVSVNISSTLKSLGYRVGLLDIDLHGPSISKMVGVENSRIEIDDNNLMKPAVTKGGIKTLSLSMLVEKSDSPIIWRGPLKIKAIQQFFDDVNWGELDFLIIDSPPGTGDEPLTILQQIEGVTGVVIVTTPQEVSTSDVARSINFVKMVGGEILGLIENMSYFVCPVCKTEHKIFGEGGGERLAKRYNIENFVKIPLDKELVKLSDTGKPYVEIYPNSEIYKIFENFIKKMIVKIE
ncbi:MAG: Mrp/NBP35 family ATP-binding protein [candidate division WOR-3 bacterium]